MTKTYRFAIIGTGGIAQKMAEALDFAPGALKYAVASRNLETAQSFAQQYGFERAYGSYEEAAADPNVDVVYVATPHNLHMQNTLMCIDHGKHVLCEKPLAVNGAEVRAMIAKAKEKGVFLMEAMWSRFLPHIKLAKQLVDDGVLGNIQMLVADFCIQRSVDVVNRKFNRELIGGSLLDIGIYPVFLSQLVMEEPIGFDAHAGIGETGVDYSLSVTLKYPGVKMGVIQSSFLVESGVKAAIYGDKASIIFDGFWFMPGNLKVRYVDGNEDVYTFNTLGNGYQYEVMEVMRCLGNGWAQSPLMSWDDSLRLIDRLDAIRKKCGVWYPGHDPKP